ncbi:30S ribosomal protein S3 [Candidatus Woesearchaeota archaeon]|nr:30S ribosomal protein S3 [Candidatus Woesearchaeota archaeon]
MIEREFVQQKKKEFQIQEFVSETLKNAGHSHTKLQRTPLGEKVVIYTSRPGLIVGRKGQTISKLTDVLKKKFGLENPQVEIAEVPNPLLDSRIVAERIASELERFGANRFKGIMHKAAEDVVAGGAVGVEIRLSGKLPGARAKSWRVAVGYLRKCGDAAMTFVDKKIISAQLKPGIIGIQVRIMPPGLVMPDEIRLVDLESKPEGSEASAVQGTAPEAAAAAVDEKAGAEEDKEAVVEVETAKLSLRIGFADAEVKEKVKVPRKRKSAAAKSKSKAASADAPGKSEAAAEAATEASVEAKEVKEAQVTETGGEK